MNNDRNLMILTSNLCWGSAEIRVNHTFLISNLCWGSAEIRVNHTFLISKQQDLQEQ